MPESLRVKIKNLHYKGIFNTSQKERLLNALDVAEKGSDINVPAKIGHWTEQGNCYECSECGIIRAKGRTGKYNYCPNCGAKMEGLI